MKLSLRDRIHIYVGGLILGIILRLIFRSIRWRWIGFDGEMATRNTAAISAFWHGQQMMMPWMYAKHGAAFGNRRLFMLRSDHRDGRLGAEAARQAGIDSIGGSSTRGGAPALQALIARLREGYHAAITPDGPRGPRCRAKLGIISLAAHSGAPIMPLGYAVRRAVRFRSWDQMVLPKPFTRGVFVAGPAIQIPAGLDDEAREAWRIKVETAINAAVELAQQELDAATAARTRSSSYILPTPRLAEATEHAEDTEK